VGPSEPAYMTRIANMSACSSSSLQFSSVAYGIQRGAPHYIRLAHSSPAFLLHGHLGLSLGGSRQTLLDMLS
jgi:hypothetical protein